MWAVSDPGSLDLTGPPTKPNPSADVVGMNMEPRRGVQYGVVGQVFKACWGQWVASYLGSLGLSWPRVKLPGLWARGEQYGMCPGHQGLGCGPVGRGGRSLICSSDWCGLYLGSWSLSELWGRLTTRRMMRWEGLGGRVGPGETESRE